MIETITDRFGNEVVIITNEDGTTLSMSKATYEAQQAEQSTPSVIDEA